MRTGRRRRPPLPLGGRGAQRGGGDPAAQPCRGRKAASVWLFDLDNTLHDANRATFPALHVSFGEYIATHLGIEGEAAQALRRLYWTRYGATLLGLVRQHGVRADHFLAETHRLPGLEAMLRGSPHDRRAIARLPGRKYVVTNGPEAYARRVLRGLGLLRLFDGVVGVEAMRMFGELRPKPDARMLRRLAVRLRAPPVRCVLVEDTLANLRAARRLGMRTVWMRRWLAAPTLASRARPAYVYARIGALRMLARHR